MQLPSLSALRVFDAAAKAGSFVKAAEQLHVTHGAVSRQIRQLEENLGLPLFERRNRAVFLTDAGRALQGTTASVFEQLDSVVQRLRQRAHDDVLVLSCEPTIAMKWLIPRLPAFQQAHPDIRLHLSAAGGPIDVHKSGVDLALRRDDFKWEGDVHALTLCEEWIGPVCSKAQARSWQTLPCLHTQSRASAWKTWLRSSGSAPWESGRIQYEHFYLCIQAALAGQGVAMASFFMVQDELSGKNLVAPQGFVQDGSHYCLLSSRPLAEDPKRQRFASWVQREMQQCAAQATQAATTTKPRARA
ncbi:LysR family transcriptional regulator [Hylemonella gracilis str. Niagara R]|uniref:LysR family transcriptional regulator n=1 Tax=Hylemonella gracilis str. Niagara R TaxID=1458275 RepID=A0A016XET2_9BURK|nr:LysR substrate-binding domain-containing protein [Hylemonella gracilis]EYC50574.1 LysR family transcriptional regulator [Hylemonella gracilis str. Niagara R]